MDHYEALLGRLVAAGQRGDCIEFRRVHDLELTDFDADVRAAGLTPEWRRDYERRVDAAVREVCSQPAGFAQRQMTNRYEGVLARMVAAAAREDCRAFRDIRNLELTDFDADARLADVSPEWRRDYERRVDAAASEACAAPSNAEPSAPSLAAQPRNARFDGQLEILRDAQAAGACGPYQTFQSVLVAEIPSLSSGERARLAEVLTRGCTPAAGSPWEPVAGLRLATDDSSSTVDHPDFSARFREAADGCDIAGFWAAQDDYVRELAEQAEQAGIEGDFQLRDRLYRERAAVEATKPPTCDEPTAIAGLWRIQQGDRSSDWKVEEYGSSISIFPATGARSPANTTVGLRNGNMISVSYPPGGGYECPRGAPHRDVADSSRIIVANGGQSMTEWVRNFEVDEDTCRVTLLDWNPLATYERVTVVAPVPPPALPAIPPNREEGPQCPGLIGSWRPDSGFSGRLHFFEGKFVEQNRGRNLDLIYDSVVRGVSAGQQPTRFTGKVSNGRFIGTWFESDRPFGTIDVRLYEDSRTFAGVLVRANDATRLPVSARCVETRPGESTGARSSWLTAERESRALGE